MTKDSRMPEQNKKNFYRKGGVSRFAGVMLLPLLLGACSSTPDWANPIEWFSSDEPEQPTKVTSAENVVPAEGFPNLSSVPGESPQTTPGNLRDQVTEGLIADRNNAEYSDQPLTARSTLVPPAPPPSVPQAPVTASPAVPASPTVTQSELPSASPQTAAAPQPSQQTTVISSQGAALPPAFPNGAPSYAPTQYNGPAFNTPSWGSPYAQQSGYTQQSSGYSSAGTGGQLVAVIYFAHGSSRLNQQDMQVIRDVASLYGQRGGQITVLGHSSSRTQLTDALTHQQVNMEISASRAQSVTQALVESGVSSSQVITDARSDTNPVFHEFMPTGEAGNRRVEIYVN
ncbi:OmpA family protein [Kiloniella laminariae]|uniref:OmpA family protein n=1 Tax=Kiloniella laminariae TaxID=454162 RepID=A0ABT4LG53_9PROT|nr:OmpA family protein [Kiloniella laminariae]MCZ4280086.1 OmpA family protein [Kiloniella laminariae]